ncbi:MAG: acyl-CoA dehydrogenase [Nitrososphaeria archaeon]|nr:acyl-CoA dehydrogenase [Nitrososphaeria archaeon]NIN52916.1 acyl-CoA dehydrogenase [Nitrososphaeria archaeon]NIQ33475.1 acyl-CoA dehydrogenase [Nitrososphaeria archaeon]
MPFEFSFTKEQEFFRKTCRDFFRDEIQPTVEAIDKAEEFPEDNIEKMAEKGLLGVPIPREYGGAEMGEVGYAIMLEELGKVCSSHATIIGAHIGLCAIPLWLFGTEEQRQRYLIPLARGKKLGAFALTEPEAGSDAAAISTTAEREGEEFVLNGQKIFITNGDRADVIIVLALTEKMLGPAGGVTAFIVERDYPGFTVAKTEEKMGIWASTTAELLFEECKIPKENVLGPFGSGFIVALTTLDGCRCGLAAGTVGGAQAALEAAVRFASERRRFGRPIAENQAVQWLLADTATEIHAARYMVYHTASMVDKYFGMVARRKRVPKAFREMVTRNAAMAKTFCSELATHAIDRCLQIYGGLGFVEGLNMEKAYRDSIIAEIYEGTNEIQRLIIARDVLNRGGY